MIAPSISPRVEQGNRLEAERIGRFRLVVFMGVASRAGETEVFQAGPAASTPWQDMLN
jgi:hypothetical protein